MDSAVMTPRSSRIRAHLKNAASALCSRSHRKGEDMSAAFSSFTRPHTYPRVTPTRRPALTRGIEPLCDQRTALDSSEPYIPSRSYTKCNGLVKGALAREVANAWERQVGKPEQQAPLNRVQSFFYDIQLDPTEVQESNMIALASKSVRRDLPIPELRRFSRYVRQSQNKPESPQWSIEKEFRSKDIICRPANGSEATTPTCEVFLGGSCNPTTWRTEIAIPKLKKMGISYFNPQVDDWSTELMEAEFQAKNVARALLFVIDSETRAVATSVEAALLAATPTPKLLLLVMRPYTRRQTIGQETISDQEYIEISRARATLKEAVERRGLDAFHDISSALDRAGEMLRGRNLTQTRHPPTPAIQRLKQYYDAAGGREARLSRQKALQALQEATRVPREVAERHLPAGVDAVDLETFCVAVAELTAGAGREQAPREGLAARLRRAFRSFCGRFTPLAAENQSRNGREEAEPEAERGSEHVPPTGLRGNNPRLRSHGRNLPLFIPKHGGSRGEAEAGGEAVLTPRSQRRLEALPGMVAKHDVYLGGTFPSNGIRLEDVLRREGYTCVAPRAPEIARVCSAPARRSAPAHPESPRRDKKPRPASAQDPDAASPATPAPLAAPSDPRDRLAGNPQKTPDNTPLPSKGTYDEDQMLSSNVVVFSISAEAPCFATMVLAAHHIGLSPSKLVLIVQPMDPATSHPYSEAAVKDYNRGRHYLVDLARRAGVPVFEGAEPALQCVQARLAGARAAP